MQDLAIEQFKTMHSEKVRESYRSIIVTGISKSLTGGDKEYVGILVCKSLEKCKT
jgi:hypothetical protein